MSRIIVPTILLQLSWCYTEILSNKQAVKEFWWEAALRGDFIGKNLMSHSTASVTSQSERWSTACSEIQMSGPLGTVLGSIWKNPNVIPSIVLLPIGDMDSIKTVLWAQPSPHPKWHLDRLSRFCTAHGCYRQTVRETNWQTTQVHL